MLTTAKRTAEFTAQQVQVWYQFLAGFRAQTIHRAVLTLCATETRFPEVADLVQLCRRIEPPEIPYGPAGTGELRPLYEPELQAIAGRFGLDIGRSDPGPARAPASVGAPPPSLEAQYGARLDALEAAEVEALVQSRLSPEAQRWYRNNGVSRGIRALLLRALEEEHRR